MKIKNKSSLIFLDDSSYSNNSECLLCVKKIKIKDFPDIVEKALSRKYCYNLDNYYFTKGIDKILNNEKTSENIFYKEWNNDDNEDGFFKRIYKVNEYSKKFNRIFCYYKDDYFKPSIFMKDKFKIHLRYYYVIERILKKEEVYEFEADTESSEDSSEDINIESKLLNDLNSSKKTKEIKFKKLGKDLNSISKIRNKFDNKYSEISLTKDLQNLIKKTITSKNNNNNLKKNETKKNNLEETKRNFKKKKKKNIFIKNNSNLKKLKEYVNKKTKKIKKSENKTKTKKNNRIKTCNLKFKTQQKNIVQSNSNLLNKKNWHKKSASNYNISNFKRFNNIKPHLNNKNKFSISLEKSNNFKNLKFFTNKNILEKFKKFNILKKSKSSLKNLKLINIKNIKKNIFSKKKLSFAKTNTNNIINWKINKINNKNILNIKNLLNFKINDKIIKKIMKKNNKTERINKKTFFGTKNKIYSDFKNFSESRRLKSVKKNTKSKKSKKKNNNINSKTIEPKY